MSESLTGQSGISWGDAQFFLVAWMLLLWPLLLNGAPFYSDDSGSYLRGGEFGFNTGLQIIEHWWNGLAGSAGSATGVESPQAAVDHAIAEAGGTRSVIYSVLTYVLRWPGISLLALAIAQAGAVALLLTVFRSLIAPSMTLRSGIALAISVSLFTPAAWYAAYVVPDIFAGVAIAGATALTVFFDRMGRALRLILVLLIAFSITVHGSHLPIAFATLVFGAAVHFWLHRPAPAASLRRVAWFASPFALAVIALLGTSYAAFGELSLAPKRYPIQLARSVADGPGAWYLRDHCATERFAICEIFGANPPRDVGDFLWAEGGVRHRATPEQMERIRAEESTIVRGAAMEYPTHQIRRSLTNTFLQLVQFGTSDLIFGYELSGRDDPKIVEVSRDRPELKRLGSVLIYLGFVAAVALLFVFRKKLNRSEGAALAVICVGLLVNAAVCGILSAVTDRYQGRVAWLLPAVAFMILLRLWVDRKPETTSA